MEPEILYEDTHILVCHKPAGMATQSARVTSMDMESWIKNYRRSKGEEAYVAVIHRLDQPVEGILVFAKNKKVAANLNAQLQTGDFSKCYYAMVSRPNLMNQTSTGQDVAEQMAEGESLLAQGELEDYLLKDSKNHMAKAGGKNQPGAKYARLSYQVMGQIDGRMLVDIKLDTGRFHQIRYQFSHRGFPIVGDVKYGGEKTNQPLCLCAYELCFVHPTTDEDMKFCIKPRWMQAWDV